MTPRRAIVVGLCVLCLGIGLAAVDSSIEGERYVAGDFALDLLEYVGLAGAVAAGVWIGLGLRGVRAGQEAIRADLARAVRDGAEWRAQHGQALEDVAEAIGRQFDAWGLTPAEADIAGLMLKGVGLRDIARLRRTSETTIRQQAQGVYRKSGLGGRAELAAYFLESLFEQRPGQGSGHP
jgi:DNA-binding CsgD family transcriptional regulator